MSRFALLFGSLTTIGLCSCATEMQKNNSALAEYQKGDCKAAASKWLPLAEQGLAAAQNNVGGIFDTGCPGAGIRQDYAQAFHWFSLAAANGDPMGMRNTGWYYQHGLWVRRDDAVAREWYISAARWGNERAKHDLEAMGVPVPTSDLLQNAQAEQAAKRQEVFDDVTALVLGAAIGVSANHDQAAPAVNRYNGAFTGTKSNSPPASQIPTTTSGLVNNPSGTSSFQTTGNTTYVTRPDGTTSAIVETVGNTNYGRDPRTGRTWTETRAGDTWSGQDSNGRTWTRQQIGDSVVVTYSDGTTKTCRAIGNQLTCS
jgi:TPR repeat protein